MKHVTVTTAIKLTDDQIKAIKAELTIKAEDTITYMIDPNVIAGMSITVDGHAFDLTVKHQLAEIEQE